MTDPQSLLDSTAVDRTKQVFRYLKAYGERSIPVIRQLDAQPLTMRLSALPSHETVRVGSVILETDSADPDLAAKGDTDGTEPLIAVRRPRLTAAPEPPDILREWVVAPWGDPSKRPTYREFIRRVVEVASDGEEEPELEEIEERLADDPERDTTMRLWLAMWDEWAQRERPARAAMAVFDSLYALLGRIERESETMELVLADGHLQRESLAGPVNHPVLIQRVELQFDPQIPEFRIVDSDRAPELYTQIIADAEGLSGERLAQLQSELERGGYHPLAEGGTTGFLERVINSMDSRARFIRPGDAVPARGTTTLSRGPVLILRQRPSGLPAAIDRVLQDLERTDEVPSALSRVVGVEPQRTGAPSATDGPPVSAWGEPPDVLLSKPANIEQVRIARALERHGAVLVQGPPGTGKSHTIANLVGHLVAQGQRVLVTSHTTKALRVLREHVEEALRPLCVALLDQDLEGRIQLEAAVRGIVARVSSADEQREAAKAAKCEAHRTELIAEVDRLQEELRIARAAEYEPVTFAGDAVRPADAAREVKRDSERHAWLPGPVAMGAPLPLTTVELATLYASNARVTPDDEREFLATLPSIDRLLEPTVFDETIGALGYTEPPELTTFWERTPHENDCAGLAALAAHLRDVRQALESLVPWQRRIAGAGCQGDAERALWVTLRDRVEVATTEYEATRELLLNHEVAMSSPMPIPGARETASVIEKHVQAGGNVGAFTLLMHPQWKSIVKGFSVDGQPPIRSTHFAAIAAFEAARERRATLARRWNRQAVPLGLPTFESLAEPPETLAREYVAQFDTLLQWWETRWGALLPALFSAGFRWDAFREYHVARSAPISVFERDVAIVTGPLVDAVMTRLGVVQRTRAERILTDQRAELTGRGGQLAMCLRRSTDERDSVKYREAYDALAEVTQKQNAWAERRALLVRLEAVAPGWARAIRERQDMHGESSIPADAVAAWRWRQLHQELERRATLDEHAIASKLEQTRKDLRATTIELIDTKAWLAQLRRTALAARQALIGWADTQRKIGKGTGKRSAEYQAKARDLLSKARDAVPVWIMPLARVAENFDPTEEKFDVVIVDEASQADIAGLLAFYLGKRIVIVGDNEQVSPSAVGQDVQAIAALQRQHLLSIPNAHLYDGKTSIYDLARQSFGGTIALREHFRCVPDIIDFSNFLSYEGQMRPLRDPATARRPHVVEHVVTPMIGRSAGSKENLDEARMIAALVAAMIKMPEYDAKSIGVISLLGEEQALEIQALALSLVGAVGLQSRKFAAGNAAQFQGDERDVVLLSMVDSPRDTGALRMSSDAMFKQRYNVAASRARDQLWLVHSLDPTRDLQPGDLRRRLIEHVRDPGAMRRALAVAQREAESPFEREVIRHLVSRGYAVQPQVEVGHYRIDLVVRYGDQQVAVECDGDRYHPVEKIPEDLTRQAVLERLGWRFVRLRGTAFYRDQEACMARVYDELARHGVHPSSVDDDEAESSARMEGDELRAEVVRRAYEEMREYGWLPAIQDLDLTSPGSEVLGQQAGLVES